MGIEDQRCAVILLPQVAQLQEEIQKLRVELTMLVSQRDALRYVECENIERKYLLLLGGMEYKVYEEGCIMLRLKRKLSLMRERLNCLEKIVPEEIEAILDKEFAEYQEKLNAQVEKMNQAIEQSHGEFLSEQETEELKRGYYTVMKALHPDLHPDLGPAQKTLFEKALKAYKEGDLTTMRIILEMLGTTNLPSPDEAVLPKLYQEKERLLPLVEGVKRNIAEIKGSFPYEVKDLVEDEEQVAARKAELQEIFDQYQERIEEYKKEIQAVLDNYDYIVQPQRQR